MPPLSSYNKFTLFGFLHTFFDDVLAAPVLAFVALDVLGFAATFAVYRTENTKRLLQFTGLLAVSQL